MGKIRLRRSALPLFILLLVLGGLLLVGRPWENVVITATISLSTDEEGPVDIHHTQAKSHTAGGEQPLVAADIDLGKWEGQLVRLDIRGKTKRWPGIGSEAGFVACALELTDATGTRPIEFIGWQNDGSSRMHRTVIGSPAFAAPGETYSSFVYSKKNLLWKVFRVPEKAVLRAAFRPVLAKDLKGKHEPFVPSIKLSRFSPANSTDTDEKRPPDVFIYLIDALRADHLGCYGYARPTSPAIDAFAEEATLFEHAQCATTWTLPSVASLLTGLFPSVHDVIRVTKDRLDESSTLLSEILHEAGYKTCLITTNSHITKDFGFTQGIDFFAFKNIQTPDWVNAQAARFLAEQDANEPIYMYLHTVEPHSPYAPNPQTFRRFDRGFKGSCDGSVEALKAAGRMYPELSTEDIEYLIDLYDAEICDNDTGFADFLDLLRRHGRYDNALIILLGDHGESFNEHDVIEHGLCLNQEELQVPLIVKFPEGRFAGQRVRERVSLIDVFPTVVAGAGAALRLGYHLPGIDLADFAARSPSDPWRHIHAEVLQIYESNRVELAAIIDEDGYKRAIDTSPNPGRGASKKSVGLWDTKADPKEQLDLSESLPVRAAYDEQLLAHWLMTQQHSRVGASPGASPPVEMSDELRQQLKALGYLD